MTGGSREGFPRAPTTSALRVIRHSQVGGRREIGRGEREEERKGRGGRGAETWRGQRARWAVWNVKGLLGHAKEDGLCCC